MKNDLQLGQHVDSGMNGCQSQYELHMAQRVDIHHTLSIGLVHHPLKSIIRQRTSLLHEPLALLEDRAKKSAHPGFVGLEPRGSGLESDGKATEPRGPPLQRPYCVHGISGALDGGG